MLTDAELKALKESKNEQEWNDACDAVKKARNGSYPSDWFAKVLLSGVAAEAQANWKKSP
jgi:hypothetical protein